eukprot:scaffold76677_cov33-Phaeocystis_antarctica.AAC.1
MRTLQAVVRDDDVALQLDDRAAVLCRLLLARVVVDDALLLACGVVDDALRGHGRHGLLQLDLARVLEQRERYRNEDPGRLGANHHGGSFVRGDLNRCVECVDGAGHRRAQGQERLDRRVRDRQRGRAVEHHVALSAWRGHLHCCLRDLELHGDPPCDALLRTITFVKPPDEDVGTGPGDGGLGCPHAKGASIDDVAGQRLASNFPHGVEVHVRVLAALFLGQVEEHGYDLGRLCLVPVLGGMRGGVVDAGGDLHDARVADEAITQPCCVRLLVSALGGDGVDHPEHLVAEEDLLLVLRAEAHVGHGLPLAKRSRRRCWRGTEQEARDGAEPAGLAPLGQ